MPRRVIDYQVPLNTVGYNPLAGWEYETIPQAYGAGAIVKIMAWSETAHALQMRVKSGSQTIQDPGILSLAAAVGQLPCDEDVSPLVFKASAGDLIGVAIDELLGAATYLMAVIDVEPVVA